MNWIRRGAWTLLALLALLVAALVVYARMALPKTAGEITLPGLSAPLSISRDEHGIPTIEAANGRDLAFGLGIVHAQDRLWQLETHRRIGAGRMAEAFGAAALDSDRFLRALGVRRAAATQWAAANSETREWLTAYAQGINSVVQNQMRARPPEFVLLGLQPEPWEPVDSLAWAVMMAWDLGGNWSNELLRLRLSLTLPVERINELLPPYPGASPEPTADYAALFRDLKLGAGGLAVAWNRLPDQASESGLEGVGSNNWVLSGQRTASGKPMLANDPHLKLSAPALWYFARLKAPGIDMAGATMPGLPALVLGQNRHIAWGFTNTAPDVQDLYLEQIKTDDPAQYRTPEGWARFESFQEVIRVKDRPDVPMTVRRTRHGPVISDAGSADDVLGPKSRPTFALALRWTALDADADPVAPALAMQRSTSVDEFVRATAGWVAPMQNMVVADREGHIGFVAAGRVPVRKSDNDLRGLVPAPGWDARYDWAGWVPPIETPRERDPERGYIATANQRIHAPDYPHFITSEWAAPYRQQRIEQMLAERGRHSLDDLAAMQADVRSLAAAKLLPWLLKARSGHPAAAAAQAQLLGFDGLMTADKAAPLIFWAWSRHLTEAVFADELGPAMWQRGIGGRTFRDALESVLAGGSARWCDDVGTPVAESCDARNDLAFTRALEELAARHGADPAAWRWGQAHVARSEHRPFSRVRALARWFELRTPVGGDTFTVNVSRVSLRPDATTGELYLDEHGPSLRALYDLADPAASRFMHSTGQSGVFFSPLYRNFVGVWGDVGYVPLWNAKPAKDVLRVAPRP